MSFLYNASLFRLSVFQRCHTGNLAKMLVEGGLIGIAHLGIQPGAAAAFPDFCAGFANPEALNIFGKGQAGVFPEDPAKVRRTVMAEFSQLRSREGFCAVFVDIGQDLLELVRVFREIITHFPKNHRQQEIDACLHCHLIAYILPVQFRFQQPEHIFKAIPFLRREMDAPAAVIHQKFEGLEGTCLKEQEKVPALLQVLVNDGGLDKDVVIRCLRWCSKAVDLIVVDDEKVAPIHRVLHTIHLVEAFTAENVNKFYEIVGVGQHRSCLTDPLENHILVNVKGIANKIDLIHCISPEG